MIYLKTENDSSRYKKQQGGLTLHHMSSGYILSKNQWKHRQRRSDCFELLFVVRGALHIQEDETKYTVSENDYLILQPYRSCFGFKYSEEEVAFYWLSFQTEELEDWGITSVFSHCDEPLAFTLLFEKLTKASAAQSNTADLYAALLLYEISAAQKSKPMVQPVMHWIKTNVSAALSVEKVAEHFGFNKDYLCKLFKQQSGWGLKKYIDAELIKKAKILLMTSSYNITQISDILLFPRPNLFNKFFKYHEKVSPLNFRKSQDFSR